MHNSLSAKKDGIINLIKTSHDLYFTLRFLPKDKRKVILQKKKDDLAELIKTPHDLNLILQCLSGEEYTTIYEGIKNQSNVFKDAFLDANYCFIGIDSTKYMRMYNLLLKEPLVKVKNCIDQAKKNLNIHTEHSNHSENKNNEISGNDLYSVLTDIKELVNQKIWCKKGISFFGKKIPEGIKKLTNVLDNTQLTEIQKLKAIKVILMEKCENRSFLEQVAQINFIKIYLQRLNLVSLMININKIK